MKKIFEKLIARWKAKTPRIFRFIIRTSMFVSGMSIAIHTAVVSAGADIPEWWSVIYPYLVGVPAGMAFVSKITQSYDKDGRPIYENKEDGTI